MVISCDRCKGTGKGRYSSFMHEGKIITLCHECRWGPRPIRSDWENFKELQTPFWKLMGQKPKPRDIAYEKYLKSRNMTYADAVMERSLKGQEKSAIHEVEKALR